MRTVRVISEVDWLNFSANVRQIGQWGVDG